MSYSDLQRRSFLIALATMIGLAAAVLCYWQAVNQGVLPSPVTPIVRRAPPAAPIPPVAATVNALELAPSPSRAPEPKAASEPKAPVNSPLVKEATESPSRLPVPNRVENSLPTDAAKPASANPAPHLTVVDRGAPSEPELKRERDLAEAPSVFKASVADEKLAEHWLSSTNDRPTVRVHYDAAEVLRLVELGRGVIVASSKDQGNPRELYLQSKPGAAPLFAPYTQSVAQRFSSYSLMLDSSPALAQLTTAFPVYFPGKSVNLAFLPDRALATEMFAQVAQASRSAIGETHLSNRTVYEGQLTLVGSEPRFELLEIVSGSKHVRVSVSGTERQ